LSAFFRKNFTVNGVFFMVLFVENRLKQKVFFDRFSLRLCGEYTAKGYNPYFPYAPSPSGGELGWGFK